MNTINQYLKPFLPFLPIALSVFASAWGIYIWRRDNRRRLGVRQVGTEIENVILALDGGLTTAVILNAALTNDSSKLTIVIHHFTVELLWNDPEFYWLYDPAEIVPPASCYKYAGTLLSYPRDMVLNHRRYEQGKLAPGDSMRGLLMGKSLAAIPSDLAQGETAEMTLIVFDTNGNKYSTPFSFRVEKRGEKGGVTICGGANRGMKMEHCGALCSGFFLCRRLLAFHPKTTRKGQMANGAVSVILVL